MGNGCSTYCSETDDQKEITDTPNFQHCEKKRISDVTVSLKPINTFALKRAGNKADKTAMMIIRVQSLIRGWLERRRYRVLRQTYQSTVKYFKLEEGQETLTGTYDPKNA